ncbi:MAG: DUF2877 domain-containing protein [bacterium]
MARVRIVQIGERARRALARSHGNAAPLAGFGAGPYFSAGAEMIWVGARLPAMHPRAVITSSPQPGGAALQFGALPAQGWTPRLPRGNRSAAARMLANLGALCRALLAAAEPRGFGLLLARRRPAFPLDRAVARVQALASAYRDDDPDAVRAASIPLLGLGTGLTPSGDDLAGAALFGRRLRASRQRAWDRSAAQLSHEVEQRSHAVSAALFRDLARGQSFAPLHTIAEALATDDHGRALAGAGELVAIGHSSGWDMFTGLVIGASAECRAP